MFGGLKDKADVHIDKLFNNKKATKEILDDKNIADTLSSYDNETNVEKLGQIWEKFTEDFQPEE